MNIIKYKIKEGYTYNQQENTWKNSEGGVVENPYEIESITEVSDPVTETDVEKLLRLEEELQALKAKLGI